MDKMKRSIKTCIFPTKEQEKLLWQAVGTARFIYNFVLNKQEENYKNGGSFIKDNDIRKEITFLKHNDEKFYWLNSISNNIPKQAVKDACNAYKRFFNHQAKKPKFKSKKKSKPSFYHDGYKLKIKENSIRLEKIGWIPIHKNSIPAGIIYDNPRVSFDGKFWYISISYEVNVQPAKLTNVSLGIDLGIKNLAVCSNGTVYKNINKTKEVRRLEKKKKCVQRKLSRKHIKNTKGGKVTKTKNIVSLENLYKLIERRLKNIRYNHIHQTTCEIVKTKPFRIVVEDLNIKGMMKNKHLSKSIQSQKLDEFIRQIKYKSELYGIQVIMADRWFPSSKMCSHCHSIKKNLKLSDRIYTCSECGLQIDRDYNASLNLANYKY